MGERLTAEEFGEWEVMYAKERWRSEKAHFRHAQLVVATMQGPSTRADRQPWMASHVTGADPWAPPVIAKSAKPLSIAAQARAINASRRRSR